ncbi:MAG: hypothetical protein E7058_03470 [Lentisphaerae bacterium]|nr:hypothetical protein [Lentisphaerota bacterium]
MIYRKFVEQEESLVPENRRRRKIEHTEKVPRKRGRKKCPMTLRNYLFLRALYLAARDGDTSSREGFAEALGLSYKLVNTMASAFERIHPDICKAQAKLQQERDDAFCRPENLTAVPMLEIDDILQRDYREKAPLEGKKAAAIVKEPRFGERLHYFGFFMPDGCMVNDGICKGDKIIAASNVRPTNGDLVACRIPGLHTVTVRRYVTTGNPALFDLYEGGTINPMPTVWSDNAIYGVVVEVQRSYWPRRLPLQDLPEKYRREELPW